MVHRALDKMNAAFHSNLNSYPTLPLFNSNNTELICIEHAKLTMPQFCTFIHFPVQMSVLSPNLDMAISFFSSCLL